MRINVLEYLEETVREVPDKPAFCGAGMTLTFDGLYREARAVGSFLAGIGLYGKPVIIFMEKGPKTIGAFLGTLYGGDYYVPLDAEMPRYRMERIFEKVSPELIICEPATADMAASFSHGARVCLYDDIIQTPIDEMALEGIREKAIDTDPIYVVFTSGSTGMPKGVMACHRSVLDYIESLSQVLGFGRETVFGNQTPLYFDACLKEIYPTLKFGATTYFVPREYFLFPLKLVEYLNEKKINTICWVVSALTMISSFGALKELVPEYLHTIAFGSEVFPMKQLKLWREALPDASFTNLYGPTEATGMCCYFKVDREFGLDERLPIGRPFRNTQILLVDENGREPAPGENGEICVRGTSVTLGYYKAFDKTREAYVQNPFQDVYPEIVYKTGDLGHYNERGELVFVSRKDYQIKHMGHRIELGEIEVNVTLRDGIRNACCVYDEESAKLILYYSGKAAKGELTAWLKERLPRYMLPNHMERLDTMPLTPNGKLDRRGLLEAWKQRKKKKQE